MPLLPNRRHVLVGAGAAAGAWALPRFSIAQADQRPTITIAVQQVANGAPLEVLREQSDVGERTFASIYDGLIGRNLQGKLEPLLFDLRDDPGQFRNPAQDAGHATVVRDYAQRMLNGRLGAADKR